MMALLGVVTKLGLLLAGILMPTINLGLMGWLTTAGSIIRLAVAASVNRRNANGGG
jgi:hypothetical protein